MPSDTQNRGPRERELEVREVLSLPSRRERAGTGQPFFYKFREAGGNREAIFLREREAGVNRESIFLRDRESGGSREAIFLRDREPGNEISGKGMRGHT